MRGAESGDGGGPIGGGAGGPASVQGTADDGSPGTGDEAPSADGADDESPDVDGADDESPDVDGAHDATSGGTGEPLTVDTVLAPIDGSDESDRAVSYAVAVAERYDADLHALIVLGEDVSRALEQGTTDEAEIAAEGEDLAASVVTVAPDTVSVTHSVALGFSTTTKARHPGSVVLDCAVEVDADFLVVPREPVTGDTGDTLEKVAEYVISYASQPVLSV